MVKLKVAVRVRPLSLRETEIASTPVISVLNEESLEITNVKVPEENVADSRERIRRFTFDYCFDENSSQNYVFEKIEKIISESIKKRNHSCVLAYGQSSTGKTHTMIGTNSSPGVIPNFCNKIFDYLRESAVGEEDFSAKVTVSYLEIYNEKVRDLLGTCDDNSKILRVREHPKKGPYVPGLLEHHVSNSSELLFWLETGNRRRKVAATHSNQQSSRSHSVFVVNCDGVKLNLIDLAGSERAGRRCFNIIRFKEGSNINKSIVALGNVISALAFQTSQQSRGQRRRFIPYRDSVLTWLLKDILGGNSNTVMVATVSPSSVCYNETVNTLRFGQRAKNIVFRPVTVEDPKEKTIRNLRAEIFRLKELLKDLQFGITNQMKNGPHNTVIFWNNNRRNTNKTPPNINEPPKLDAPNKDPLFTKDELIPLIDVETSLDDQRNPLETTKMNREKQGNYSSDDSIQSSKSIASSSEKDSGQQTPSDDLRRQSLTKSNTSLSKTPPKRGSLENLDGARKRMERAISTEQLSKKFESKVSLNTKKPRSQVVAAVTSRLYNKAKKKDASTDTDDINGVLDLLTESAKSRLREITRKALRAHRIKHQDTQTDFLPARRMKERSTDSRDLKLELLEVKHSETMTIIDTQDASVECTGFVNIFGDEDADRNFCFTRTCGTQFNKDESERRLLSKPQAIMSFTKYLREVKEECSNDAIYTNVVNINISNHYSKEKLSASSSSDSLDLIHAQSLVTPDLLSNHPPLETCSKEVQTWLQGSVVELNEKFPCRTTDLPNDDSFKDFSKAKCTVIPNHFIAVPSVKMLKTHVPEIFVAAPLHEDFCEPLPEFASPSAFPKIVESQIAKRDDFVIVTEPPALEPIALNQLGEATVQNAFRKKIRKSGDITQRMVSAMSVFLEEAADMMSKFSEKIETRPNYELELTVNNLDVKTHKKKKKIRRARRWDEEYVYSEKGSQTLNPIKYSCSTQSEAPISLPVNKYEEPLRQCCASLEAKIGRVSWAPSLKISDDEGDDTDELLSESAPVEGSSLGSTPPAYSDYGSLPKRKKVKYKTLATASPKTYLEQLRCLRKNIVEKSRDNFV
ncbi:unnamed protein product [Phyllotreta striolata]|uniref:Kinesin motor domain-containing protein n=1 Tax=Phyllotreta striolata TaxID=444603 RepID=A0A9P0GXT6_PHYSR|nr:unnamed protein product [Phyllotreta striolata]